ncbi:MAG: hypothetical protein JWR00_834 [Rubritepida sp.]|nr:hypothetical protein [Rubritepida sp.]
MAMPSRVGARCCPLAGDNDDITPGAPFAIRFTVAAWFWVRSAGRA